MFSERLKELREETKLTQDKLAELTKISQSAISKYELNLQKPTSDVIIILCKFFKVSADYILGLID